MGFFSRLFGGHISRDRWYVKVDLITELSEIARRYWRDEWGAAVESGLQRGAVGAPPSRFDAPADRRFAQVQAAWTADFIARQQYLPAGERADFGAFLLRSMLGGVSDDTAAPDQPAGFAAAMARALDASDADAAAAEIHATLPACELEQQYITALAFSDAEAARRLKAQIEGEDSGA